jgi:hypothetical protein
VLIHSIRGIAHQFLREAILKSTFGVGQRGAGCFSIARIVVMRRLIVKIERCQKSETIATNFTWTNALPGL